MYIEPNTNIKILKNVPLDTTYDHTIYFSSTSAQTNYFAGLTKYNLTSQTYQRVKRGYARVQRKAEDLYDCNYMMFQNSAYGNKWFYAFITSVEYVNNVTSEITFEIDDIQTWFFDFTLDMCYVEREHSVTDEIGDNIMPEPCEVGEYIFNGFSKITSVLDAFCVVIGYTETGENESKGNFYNGCYSGVTYTAIPIAKQEDIETVNSFVSKYIQSPDSIVTMYMCPTAVALDGQKVIPGTVTTITYSEEGWHYNTDEEPANKDMLLDGYPVKNKKLLTYPYNYFFVCTGNGKSLSLRYEFFKDLQPKLRMDSIFNQPIRIRLTPKDYKNVESPLLTESLTLDNYPACSWNIDAYKVWYAQNIVPMTVNAGISGALSAGSLLAYAYDPVSNEKGKEIGLQAGADFLKQIKNNMIEGYKASISADILKGNINSGNLCVSTKEMTFYKSRVSISNQYARSIDNFFSRYGYATKKVKIPNTHVRPHWNYVKTIGCTATGSIPADAMHHICSIHDKGITYWKNGNEIGDYSLDNSPN